MIYCSIFLFLAILALSEDIKEFRRLRYFFVVLVVIILALFAGLRAPEVMPDYAEYADTFNSTPSLTAWVTGDYIYSFARVWMEPLYVGFGAFIKIFSNNHVVMFVCVAFLSVGLASYKYYKISSYVFLTLLLFYVHTYFYRDMTQIRAAVAAAIGLFLIPQIHSKKYCKSVVTVMLAAGFHMASLSYLIIFLASFLKINKSRVIAVVSASIFLGFLGVSGFFIRNLPDLGYLSYKIRSYSKSQYVESIGVVDITNIKNIAIVLVAVFFWDKMKARVKYFETLMLFMTTGTAWRLAFSDFGILAARVATFFTIVEVILVSSFVLVFRQKFFAILLLVFYSFIVFFLNMDKKLSPYEFAPGVF